MFCVKKFFRKWIFLRTYKKYFLWVEKYFWVEIYFFDCTSLVYYVLIVTFYLGLLILFNIILAFNFWQYQILVYQISENFNKCEFTVRFVDRMIRNNKTCATHIVYKLKRYISICLSFSAWLTLLTIVSNDSHR